MEIFFFLKTKPSPSIKNFFLFLQTYFPSTKTFISLVQLFELNWWFLLTEYYRVELNSINEPFQDIREFRAFFAQWFPITQYIIPCSVVLCPKFECMNGIIDEILIDYLNICMNVCMNESMNEWKHTLFPEVDSNSSRYVSSPILIFSPPSNSLSFFIISSPFTIVPYEETSFNTMPSCTKIVSSLTLKSTVSLLKILFSHDHLKHSSSSKLYVIPWGVSSKPNSTVYWVPYLKDPTVFRGNNLTHACSHQRFD